MNPRYVAGVLILALLCPPSLQQGYGGVPQKKKHTKPSSPAPEIIPADQDNSILQPSSPDGHQPSGNQAPFWWQQSGPSPFMTPSDNVPCGPGGCSRPVQPAPDSSSSISGNPFLPQMPHRLPAQGPQPGLVMTCTGSGTVCVEKYLCQNGYVTPSGLSSVQSSGICEIATKVCCRLPAPSQPGIKTVGKVNFAPQPPPSQSQISNTISYTPGRPNVVQVSSPHTGLRPGGSVPGTNGVPIGGSVYDYPTTRAPNPSPYTGPLNTTPHPGCAAALKCVEEIYCTVEGVMSDQPVRLTREQYENRVPLTDCLNPEQGFIGKCCRDPNYEDPWPGGMMMKNGNMQGQIQPFFTQGQTVLQSRPLTQSSVIQTQSSLTHVLPAPQTQTTFVQKIPQTQTTFVQQIPPQSTFVQQIPPQPQSTFAQNIPSSQTAYFEAIPAQKVVYTQTVPASNPTFFQSIPTKVPQSTYIQTFSAPQPQFQVVQETIQPEPQIFPTKATKGGGKRKQGY